MAYNGGYGIAPPGGRTGAAAGLRQDRCQRRKPMIFIDEMYCKGCGICVRYCPKKILELSDRVNSRGVYIPVVTDESKCNFCNNCDLYCPDFAIFVEKEEDEGE